MPEKNRIGVLIHPLFPVFETVLAGVIVVVGVDELACSVLVVGFVVLVVKSPRRLQQL